jgi:hypothetical protein
MGADLCIAVNVVPQLKLGVGKRGEQSGARSRTG